MSADPELRKATAAAILECFLGGSSGFDDMAEALALDFADRAIAVVGKACAEVARAEVKDRQRFETPHGTDQICTIWRHKTLDEAIAAILTLTGARDDG